MNHERAHLYDPTDNSETLVVVGFDIDGYKRLDIQEVRVDLPGEPGPNIIDTLTDYQLDLLHGEICAKGDWAHWLKKNRDVA